MKARFIVEFELPAGATVEDAVDFLQQHALDMVGNSSPDHPLWNVNRQTLKVRPTLQWRESSMPRKAGMYLIQIQESTKVACVYKLGRRDWRLRYDGDSIFLSDFEGKWYGPIAAD